MTRKEIVTAMLTSAAELAKEMGLTHCTESESNVGTWWGDGMKMFCDHINGKDSRDVRWSDDEGNRVDFRYRFTYPCICIHDANGSFCEVEFSCPNEKENFEFGSVHIYMPAGFGYQERIIKKLNEHGVEI